MWWGKSVLNQKKIWNAKVGKNSSDIPRFGIDLQKPGLDMNRWEQMFWCLRKCWNNYWHGNSGVFVGFFPLPKFWLIWYIYIYSKVKGKNDWMKFRVLFLCLQKYTVKDSCNSSFEPQGRWSECNPPFSWHLFRHCLDLFEEKHCEHFPKPLGKKMMLQLCSAMNIQVYCAPKLGIFVL